MKDLQMLANECLKEVKMVGIQPGFITEFTVNNRAKTRFGQCRLNRITNTYRINISSFVLEDYVPIVSVKNTIIHEILHTCENCFDHGKEWQRLADIVNRKYGYNISRLGNCTNEGIKDPTIESAKYIVTCKECGLKTYRSRKSRLTEYPQYFTCTCGGELEVQKVR